MDSTFLLQGYPFPDEPPTGWERTTLGQISDEIRPGFASGEHNKEGEGILHLRPMNISPDGEIDLTDVRFVEPLKSLMRIRKGEILFNNTNSQAWVGKTALIRQQAEFAFSNHMTRIKVNDAYIHSDFISRQLHFLCTSGYFRIHSKKHVNQASISGAVLEQSVPILVPPLNEQKRIVARIEQLQARSRRAKEALETIPDLLDQLRQSILAAAFRGDLTKTWREQQRGKIEPADELLKRIGAERRKRWEAAELDKLKAKGLDGETLADELAKRRKQYKEPEPVDTTNLPELPEGWIWISGECVVPVAAPIVYGIILPGPHVEDGVPYIRPLEIQNDTIIDEPIPRTSPEIAAQYERAKLSTGDIILSIVGTIGKVAIVPGRLEGANITQSSARLRPWLDFITRDYLAEVLRSPLLRTQYERFRFGNAVQRLNIAHVRALAIPLPPIEEQAEIVKIVHAKAKHSQTTLDFVEICLKQIVDLTNSILSKAFRGELVPQDPNDEPASVLLERIRREKALQETGKKSSPAQRGRKRSNSFGNPENPVNPV